MAKIPSKIGKYVIESLIASGGMGEVYKGIHPTLNRSVILKKLTLKNDEQLIQRFNREARIMMDFKNENIVNVYDHFKEGDSYYIVLEFVDGLTLDSLIKQEGFLPNEIALYILMEISKALIYAHKNNVVHRDIKPSNILISKTGNIKLVDFGIAISEDENDEDLTTVGMTLGTPSYMAPEQFENSKFVDKRADIYSLGVVLFEMVTGEKPFPSGLTPKCISLIQKGKYTNPKKLNKSISSNIISLIHKLMHHKVNKRTQDLEKTEIKIRKTFNEQELKKYKDILSDAINGKSIEYIPVKRNKWALLFIPVFILLSYFSFEFINKGYHYDLFRFNTYGALELNLKVNKGYYKEVDEIFIQSKLFNEIGSDLLLVENSNYPFVITPNTDEKFHIYKTKRLYLPVGFYRLKVIVDGNLFWKNFQVLSRKNQKNGAYVNGQVILLEHKESEPLPFHPILNVFDQVTGKNITSESTIFIQNNGKFKKFDIKDTSLKTGTVHYFQFSKKGYYSKDYILKISHDQTDLKLDAQLFPKPGKITIKTAIEGLKIYINNKSFYIKGDRSEEKIKLTKVDELIEDILLTPGNYIVGFSYKGNKIEKEIDIKSDGIFNIEVNYNKDSKSLSFTE